MKYLRPIFYGILLFAAALFFSQCRKIQLLDEYYCTIQSGEPSQTSIILLARLQKSDTLLNNDIPGINGFVKFRVTRDTESKSYLESRFFECTENNDFISKYEFSGLRPGQKYFYKIFYGKDTSNVTSSPWNSFKTLNLPNSDKNVGFIIANGLEFDAHSTLNFSGIHVLNSISSLKPEFWIINGEYPTKIVKNNDSGDLEQSLVMEWHRLFNENELGQLLSNCASFWMIPNNNSFKNITEQHIPLFNENKDLPINCRTYSLNRDIQIWLLENNGFYTDYAESQTLKWLKKSIKESDSPFKLLIGPSAIFDKNDLGSQFNTKKDSLFSWFKNNGLRNNGLYFISCNDDKMYHAIDPSGFEEFSCGKLFSSTESVDFSRKDTSSNFQKENITYPFINNPKSSGFLMINSGRDEYNSPVLLFRYFDENRNLLYAVNKF